MRNAWSRRDVVEVPRGVGEGGVVEREGHPPPSTAGSSAPNRGCEQGGVNSHDGNRTSVKREGKTARGRAV